MNVPNSAKTVLSNRFSGRLAAILCLFKFAKKSQLGSAAINGSLISIFGFSLQKVLQLFSNIVLSRLLFPEAFGLMALATVFLTAISMLSDIGINQSIIQSKQGSNERFLNTAWTMSIVRGFAIALVVCAIAWPASEIYDSPILFPLLCVLSVTSIFQGFTSVAIATQNRDLKFIRVVAIEVATAITAMVVTILVSIYWKSVWSLAIGAITSSILRMLLSHWLLPCHRLRISLDMACASEIFKFGKWIVLATLVSFIAIQGLPLIQGWFVSVEVLGILSIATALAVAPRELMIKLVNTVAYPVFSRVTRENSGALPGIVNKARMITNAAAIILFLTLALIAQPLVDFLYDERYGDAGIYLSILAVNGALGFLPDLYQIVQLAKGRSNVHFVVMSVLAVSRSAGMIFGYKVAGIEGMLYGLCVGSFIAYFISAVIAARSKVFCFWADTVTLLIISSFVALIY